MARHYHVDIARFAATVDRKWIDNLLSHFDIPGVDGGKQGVARRVSSTGIYHIALIRRLCLEFGVPTERAVQLAGQLLTTNATHVTLGADLELKLDRDSFQRTVDALVAEAVESVVPRRRGRPPGAVPHGE